MKLQRLVVGLVVGIAMLGASAVQAAPIIIDSFGTVFVPSPLTAANSPDGPVAGLHLGLRTSSYSEGPGVFPGSVTIVPGSLGFATLDTEGFLSLAYSAFGTLDLTGQQVLVPFTFYDPAGINTTDVTVTLATLAGLLSETQQIPGVFDPDGFLLSFSSFAGIGDISQVTGITFSFDAGGRGVDFVLGDGGIRIQEVPEPSTLALLGLASLGMAVYSRRKLLAKRVA